METMGGGSLQPVAERLKGQIKRKKTFSVRGHYRSSKTSFSKLRYEVRKYNGKNVAKGGVYIILPPSLAFDFYAVSYTHLDVYKRQMQKD